MSPDLLGMQLRWLAPLRINRLEPMFAKAYQMKGAACEGMELIKG
jgi:hypothetical protein